MYARVLFSWPVEPPYRPLTNEVAEIEPEIVNALTRIIDLVDEKDDAFGPRTIPMSQEAVEVFEGFRRFQHGEKNALNGREREWWAKSPAHVLRLAGTLCYVTWAWVGGAQPERIEAEFVQAAVRLVGDYFWPHSRAALRQIGLNERHAHARRLLRWARAQNSREISLKDARREALGQSSRCRPDARTPRRSGEGWVVTQGHHSNRRPSNPPVGGESSYSPPMQKVQKVQKTTERGGFCTSCSSCTLRNGCHIRGKAADFRYPGGHPNFAINPMN